MKLQRKARLCAVVFCAALSLGSPIFTAEDLASGRDSALDKTLQLLSHEAR
jgi:hypothetical protein